MQLAVSSLDISTILYLSRLVQSSALIVGPSFDVSTGPYFVVLRKVLLHFC